MGNSPKLRPVKMSDTLRTAFGFKEGSHVTISKSISQLSHARKVTLTDVTPSDYGSAAEADTYNKWRTKCASLLADAEAFAVGTTFDVSARKGLRKRFYVEHVDSPAQTNGLFLCNDDTEIFLSGDTETTEIAIANREAFPDLGTRIGGLVDEVKELNKRLDRILSRNGRRRSLAANRHVIIYGYEGTGKSLLLQCLEQTTTCKVYKLSKSELTTGKIQSTIQTTFRDASVSQPSVVLMDDIDELASPENNMYARCIGAELDKLKGTNVLAIAAARSVSSVDSILTGPGRLSKQIELPIPSIEARRQILNILLGKSVDASDQATTTMSLKTHGFTGKDLGLLVEQGADNALRRVEGERDEWVSVHARVSMLNGAPADEQTDGSLLSQATTEVGSPQSGPTAAQADGEFADCHVTLEDLELALGVVRPTALREIFLETPKVQWSDIGGSGLIEQRFEKIIGWPRKYSDIMRKWNIKPQKGVLLYGPPGCSKTMTAQAVATTYDLNFIAVKGAELISMYVGESERAVREVFRKARQAAPCIIFFDEIDAIGSERESGGTKGLNVLTTLLNEMDGFEAMKDVLVLAATNKPEVLDPALLRPGRFDQHVYVGLPDQKARRDIIELSLRNVRVSADLVPLVGATEGYSGAEIVGICSLANEAAAEREVAGSLNVKLESSDFEAAMRLTRKGVTMEMLKGYEEFALH